MKNLSIFTGISECQWFEKPKRQEIKKGVGTMKNKKTIFITLSVLLFILISVNLQGQSKVLNTEEGLQKIVNETESRISKYERSGKYLLFLIILIGSLGIIVATVQTLKDWPPMKPITFVSGILVGILTLVMNTSFESTDYKLIGKTTGNCRKCIKEVRIKMLQSYTTDKERREMLESIYNQLKKIEDLVAYGSEKAMASIQVNRSVNFLYAAPQLDNKPDWVIKTPNDEDNFYFTGIGNSISLEEAKTKSLQNSIALCREFLLFQFEKFHKDMTSQVNDTLLAENLLNSIEISNTFFNRDPRTKQFIFYTLIKLGKRNLNLDLKFYGLQENRKVPDEYQDIAKINQSPESQYFKNRIKLYNQLLDQSLLDLSPMQMDLLNTGRDLRKKSLYKDSIEKLERLVSEQAASYMAWYNLALSYDAEKNFTRANAAYLRAVQLEPTQPVRDSSIYNTYGYFLFQQKKFSEACIYLKKALEIEPNHPKARNTLKAAEERSR